MRQGQLAIGAVLLVVVAAGCGRKPPEPIPEIHAARPAAAALAAVASEQTEGAETSEPESVLTPPASDDWPCWRGPRGNNAQPDADPPTEWTDRINVVWKSPLAGRGHSSPIIRGDRLFVATADEAAKEQSLVCLDRVKGKHLWSTTLHTGGFDHAHEKNSQASATPACDGEKVYITFLNNHSIWLSAVDLDGNKVWQREVGPFDTIHGYAASPALYKSLVIVAGDSNRGGFLAGIDRKSGEILWRIARPAETSFSSPIIAHVAGRDQLLISGAGVVDSYDPETGDRVWYYTGGPTATTSGTVAFDDERVYASGGFPGKQTLCIRADGKGDITKTHLVWKNTQKFYVPSLLVYDGRIYAVTDDGVAYCYDSKTGKQLDVRRLGGGFSSSPTLAGQHVYLTNEEGKTFVLKPGDKLMSVAQNDLHSGGFATPAVSGKHLFLRTDEAIVCVGN